MFHLDRLRRGAIQQGQPFDTMKWPNEAVTDPAQLHGWRSTLAAEPVLRRGGEGGQRAACAARCVLVP